VDLVVLGIFKVVSLEISLSLEIILTDSSCRVVVVPVEDNRDFRSSKVGIGKESSGGRT